MKTRHITSEWLPTPGLHRRNSRRGISGAVKLTRKPGSPAGLTPQTPCWELCSPLESQLPPPSREGGCPGLLAWSLAPPAASQFPTGSMAANWTPGMDLPPWKWQTPAGSRKARSPGSSWAPGRDLHGAESTGSQPPTLPLFRWWKCSWWVHVPLTEGG